MSLVILSLKYPYGLGEAFLHEEVLLLSKHFDRITIIPSSFEGERRPLPSNVYCHNANSAFPIKSGIAKVLFRYPFTAARIILYELFSNPHRLKYLKYWKSFAGHLVADLEGYDNLYAAVKSHSLQSCLFYDYWFSNRSLSLARLARKKKIKNYVLRAHRFDLYDDVQFEETVPFRNYRLKHATKVFTISKHGENYLSKRAGKFKSKIKCSYLGAKTSSGVIVEKKSDEYLVVSCGRLIDSKQSHQIPFLFQEIKNTTKVKWVHFGDGPLKEDLLNNLSVLPSSVSFEFMGEVPNEDILSYYKLNYVDLFISLSLSEGIPVSIMEAMMYGIPTLAYGVNGVPEIVTKNTGWCLPSSMHVNEIDINFYLEEQSKMDRREIRKLTVDKFDSEINYKSFLSELNQIQ